MGFLIAEIVGLLALAALFGGVFVYWWLRRNFVEVTHEYSRYERALTEVEDLRKANTDAEARIAALEAANAQLEVRLEDELGQRTHLGGKLDELRTSVGALRNTDVSSIEAGVSTIEAGVAGVSAAVAAMKPASVQPVMERLDELGRHVAGLENADFSGVDEGIRGVAASLGAVEAKLDDLRPADLSPFAKRLDSIEKTVAGLRNADLAPVEKQLRGLGDRVAGIGTADLTPVSNRLAEIDRAVRGLRNTDLGSVEKRLERIENGLARTPAKRPAERKARPEAGALLKSASYGKPDDLKRIKGVGPKLEKMLNGIGVYYFFQIEAWKKADVRRVDDLLDAFKGRIERDEWVTQARGFARQPGSAQMA